MAQLLEGPLLLEGPPQAYEDNAEPALACMDQGSESSDWPAEIFFIWFFISAISLSNTFNWRFEELSFSGFFFGILAVEKWHKFFSYAGNF